MGRRTRLRCGRLRPRTAGTIRHRGTKPAPLRQRSLRTYRFRDHDESRPRPRRVPRRAVTLKAMHILETFHRSRNPKSTRPPWHILASRTIRSPCAQRRTIRALSSLHPRETTKSPPSTNAILLLVTSYVVATSSIYRYNSV